MMFLPDYMELQEWGNILNEKKFKIYKQQIISHTNLTISKTENIYINNAPPKNQQGRV